MPSPGGLVAAAAILSHSSSPFVSAAAPAAGILSHSSSPPPSTPPIRSPHYDFSHVDAVLLQAVQAGVFPGAAAAVRDSTGDLVYAAAVGNLTYGAPPPPLSGGANPPVDWAQTLFDMASCSKIIGPTTTSAYLWQEGLLPLPLALDTPVASPSLLGPAYANNGKEAITLRNLLLHDAGYPPDPSPGYWQPAFGCPNSNTPHPALDFSCADLVFAGLLNQTAVAAPGAAYVYSDLSMITLLYALGTLIRTQGWVTGPDFRPGCADDLVGRPGLTRACAFEAYWRLHILPRMGMPSTTYLPPPSLYGTAAPAWNDTDYRHEVLQGVVSDENSYASGGIQGHAGIFSTGFDASTFTAVWAFGYAPPSPSPGAVPLLNASTVRAWTTAANATFSPRALGWTTQAATDTYQGCGGLSAETYYHTGYTGTLLCVDPTRNVTTVLLANRVYPNSTGETAGIQAARQAFNTAVLAALEGGGKGGA
jgi:serine-type D-Ala-D-Ala carboxypeptidase